jgi:hypothetical protein
VIFESVTGSKHPNVRRWYEFLGYKFRSKSENYMTFQYHAAACPKTLDVA